MRAASPKRSASKCSAASVKRFSTRSVRALPTARLNCSRTSPARSIGAGSRRRDELRVDASEVSSRTSMISASSSAARASLAARRSASVASSGIEPGAALRTVSGRRWGVAASTASRQARDAPTTRRPVAAPAPRRATPPQVRGVSSGGPSAHPSSVVDRRVARSSPPLRARPLGAPPERERSELGALRLGRPVLERSEDPDRLEEPDRPEEPDGFDPDPPLGPPLEPPFELPLGAPFGAPPLGAGRDPPRGLLDLPERDEPEEGGLAIGPTYRHRTPTLKTSKSRRPKCSEN